MEEDQIKQSVRKHYASVASEAKSSCCDSGCCGDGQSVDIQLIDYGEFNKDIPEGANLGLGCGIPTLYADLREGETVLDLGSGAGIDVFLAARKVGSKGRAIGVDMTPEMIARARENAQRGGYDNVEFHLGDIENLPLKDGEVDVVLSNCVINLTTDKARVYREIFRVLKPEGRFLISDVVTFGEVPAAVRTDMELWAGCVAGAMDRDEYLAIIHEAGFSDVEVKSQSVYENGESMNYGIASITLEGRKA